MTRLHEQNYAKLVRIVPQIMHLKAGNLINRCFTDSHIEIAVEEHTRYTSCLRLAVRFSGGSQFLPKISIQVRLYHDAKVAEVIDFQQKRRFQSRYPYPNPGMHQRNEKQQINLFLAEWLDHCIRHGIVITHREQLSS